MPITANTVFGMKIALPSCGPAIINRALDLMVRIGLWIGFAFGELDLLSVKTKIPLAISHQGDLRFLDTTRKRNLPAYCSTAYH